MSDIVGPNGQPASNVNLTIERATVGGTPVEYQTDPRIAITSIPPEGFGLRGVMLGAHPAYVFGNPENLLQFLVSQINVNSALIRELLTQRTRIDALQAALEERVASAPTERIERHDVDDIIAE